MHWWQRIATIPTTRNSPLATAAMPLTPLMSRKTLFIRGVSIGYLATAVNIVYSLVSIPLVLQYLGKELFGLWAVVMSVTGYFQLLELNISHGIGRLQIEYKDDRESGEYCSVLTTGGLALAAASVVILIIGVILAPYVPGWLNIKDQHASLFTNILVLNVLIAVLTIGTKIFMIPLYAYQRHDLLEANNIILFIVLFGTLWLGLHMGMGLYAMVFSAGIGLIVSMSILVMLTYKHGYYPKVSEFGMPAARHLREIMSYSGNTFISSIGGIMLKSAPTLIITRMLGLNATATWSVCAKPFDILAKIVNRPMDNSGAALCEMYIRNERAHLKKRMSQIVQLTAAIAGVGSMVFAFMSPAFVHLWTNGKIVWPLQNFIALGLMTSVYATMRITSGFVGISKVFGFMRYIYFVEALALIFICWLFVPIYGVIVIPIAAMACHILFSSSLGLFYFNQSLGFNLLNFLKVIYQPLLAVLIMLGSGLVVGYAMDGQTTYLGFFLQGFVMSVIGLLSIAFIGIDAVTRHEITLVTQKFIFAYLRRS